MGLARSTFYDTRRDKPIEEARLTDQIQQIAAEWPAYGYRRITAELHATGFVVNHKKVMRLMKEYDLTVRPRRRYVATTDSKHDGPIFPNLAKDLTLTAPNQLWVADFTYIAIASGFVYLAAILDAWSRRVVGYALGRRIDARLAIAALRAAVIARAPLVGCIHHSDRGCDCPLGHCFEPFLPSSHAAASGKSADGFGLARKGQGHSTEDATRKVITWMR